MNPIFVVKALDNMSHCSYCGHCGVSRHPSTQLNNFLDEASPLIYTSRLKLQHHIYIYDSQVNSCVCCLAINC